MIAPAADAPFDLELINSCELYLRRAYNDGNGDSAQNGEWALVDACAPTWRTVFDVGACIGDWSLRVLAANPAAEIHCFEPFPPNVDALRDRMGDKAQIVPMALGAADGEAIFHMPGNSGVGANLGSLYQQGAPSSLSRVRVPIIPLVDYCEAVGIERIDCLKIDAEGAEMDILQGALPMLQQGRIGMVQFEYGGTWVSARRYLKDVFDLIKGTDYKVAKLMQRGSRPVTEYFFEIENFHHSNWLLFRQHPDEPASAFPSLVSV